MSGQLSQELAPATVGRSFPAKFATRPMELDLLSTLLSTSGEIRRWLVRRARSTSGAVYAWVDAATGAPAFEYPEITGYALTFCA